MRILFEKLQSQGQQDKQLSKVSDGLINEDGTGNQCPV